MKQVTPKQLLCFTAGTALNALGISLVTKAYLGTSPISSLPFVLSLGLTPTFGELTFAFNMLFLVGQILLQRRNFPMIQLLQIPVTVVFSILIDLFMYLFRHIKPEHYLLSLILLFCGCCVMALGITLSIRAHFLMTPADAFVRALADYRSRPFGSVKVRFDTLLMILAVICSFHLFGRFRGVREGTLFSSFLVGNIINFYQRHLPEFELS